MVGLKGLTVRHLALCIINITCYDPDSKEEKYRPGITDAWSEDFTQEMTVLAVSFRCGRVAALR